MVDKKLKYKDIESFHYKYAQENEFFHMEFSTVERYSLRRLVSLKYYLQDILVMTSKEHELFGKIAEQLNVLNNILNTPNSIEMRFVPQAHDLIFERIVPYGRTQYYKKELEIPCGRLYPIVSSISSLSRQIRSYLFYNKYQDYYLVNSHPSILANYADVYDIQAECLFGYVNNREAVLKDLSENMKISREASKKLILTAQNKYPMTGNTYLKSYSEEINIIRNHMFTKDYFTAAVGKESSLLSSLSVRESFKQKTLEQQKITYQSYYCFNQESFLLTQLRSFLLDKLKADEDPHFFNQKVYLHFIPFFDGAYLNTTSDDPKKIIASQFMLKGWVDDFNRKHKFFKFVPKTLLVDKSDGTYLDDEILSSYLRVLDTDDFYDNFDFDLTELDDLSKDNKKLLKAGILTSFNKNIQLQIRQQTCYARQKYFKENNLPRFQGFNK